MLPAIDYCGTEDNPSNFGGADRDSHSMNSGAPHLWFNASATSTTATATTTTTAATAGLGLVALDDVFRVHAQCSNLAVPQLNPRVSANCVTTSPPSIRLSDPNLALPSLDEHTHEWAVYPFDSRCSDWFCFVNRLRYDYGTEDIVLGERTGVLSGMESGANADVDDMSQWARSGYIDPRCNNSAPRAARRRYCQNWTEWQSADLLAYMNRQGDNVMPVLPPLPLAPSLPQSFDTIKHRDHLRSTIGLLVCG